MYWIGVLTAAMTAFYVFRALFLAFFGEYRGHAHPHESPWVMTGPLVVLALLSAGGGFINVPRWLEPMFPAKAEGGGNEWLMYTSVAAGVIGIGFAYMFYIARPGRADAFAKAANGLYTLVYNKYFVDEVYDAAVVKPVVNGSRIFLWRGVDAGFIDGIVNGAGTRSRGVGNILKLLQSGNIRSYAAWVVLGSVLLLLAIGFGGATR
jgi:NADH-quinone oxidoreductase subunit L